VDPVEVPGITADPNSIIGEWQIVSAMNPRTGEQMAPLDWSVQFTEKQVILPEACNVGAGAEYLADPDGKWAFGGQAMRTAMLCEGVRMESEDVYDLLMAARSWTLDANTLRIFSDTVAIDLARL
jgi:heat shock protein HslJ